MIHKHHESYVKIRMSEEILDFISQRCAGHSPAEIYHDLQASGLREIDGVAQHQVYYQWQQVNSSKWKYDAEPFTSAYKFLITENKYRVCCLYYR